ncbi:SCO3242 family prenyltransferase [Streptomyces sp. NPDC046237]|uniref:SCO3242 family prenyltransferase n=1 Tax=Streptomyces sp. NPDC046237 TaxID=3154914 RepID=UPI003402BEEA
MSGASGRAAAWAELLRVSALATVPGDALAGAAAAGLRPNRSTLLAIGSSLCLYEAGMALNDWADRAEDAVDRPHRPLPSGRITPRAALAASAVLTAAGLTLAARAGRPALATATALAATVWSYDLRLKHTPAAPATMATARSLNLLLGTIATTTGRPGARRGGRPPVAALPSAALLGAHTYAVTAVSRHEAQGGSTRTPLLALATTVALAAVTSRPRTGGATGDPRGAAPGAFRFPAVGPGAARVGRRKAVPVGVPAGVPGAVLGDHALVGHSSVGHAPSGPPADIGPGGRIAAPIGPLVTAALAVAYARTPAAPLLHAALNPSPPLTQRSVGAGIRALIPLQAALAARAGAPGTALLVLGLAPLARALARKVSPT